MDVGVVVIGRNEGDRLRICLQSVDNADVPVVYVDSGSTDGSVELARRLGHDVLELDMSIPFTAARARNEGFERLLNRWPDLRFVQFVDGDCELRPGWLEHARQFMETHSGVAMVCGRLRERYPERSVYNMLCDMEWDAPPGESRACGGIAMVRVDDFRKAGGYRPDLIAGEEPELCVRLRQNGCRIWRLDAEMAWHDAAMMRFGQWWRRSVRGGYAYAEGVALHGKSPEQHWVREYRRAWFWGGAIPMLAVLLVYLFGSWGASVLAVYPMQVMRLTLSGPRSMSENFRRATFLVLGKFPEMMGQIVYWRNRLVSRTTKLIEYK